MKITARVIDGITNAIAACQTALCLGFATGALSGRNAIIALFVLTTVNSILQGKGIPTATSIIAEIENNAGDQIVPRRE